MTADNKRPSRIPIRFLDTDESEDAENRVEPDLEELEVIDLNDGDADLNEPSPEPATAGDEDGRSEDSLVGGPEFAELIARKRARG